jgi:hypothetical protein
VDLANIPPGRTQETVVRGQQGITARRFSARHVDCVDRFESQGLESDGSSDHLVRYMHQDVGKRNKCLDASATFRIWRLIDFVLHRFAAYPSPIFVLLNPK